MSVEIVPGPRAMSPVEGLGSQVGADIERIRVLGEQLILLFRAYDVKLQKLAEHGVVVEAQFLKPIESAFATWKQLQKEPGRA